MGCNEDLRCLGSYRRTDSRNSHPNFQENLMKFLLEFASDDPVIKAFKEHPGELIPIGLLIVGFFAFEISRSSLVRGWIQMSRVRTQQRMNGLQPYLNDLIEKIVNDSKTCCDVARTTITLNLPLIRKRFFRRRTDFQTVRMIMMKTERMALRTVWFLRRNLHSPFYIQADVQLRQTKRFCNKCVRYNLSRQERGLGFDCPLNHKDDRPRFVMNENGEIFQ